MIEQPRYPADPAGFYTPCQGAGGYELLSIAGVVVSPTVPGGSVRVAKVYFRGPGNVRATFNGTDPDASTGVPFYDGHEELFSVNELKKIRLIREGSTNGSAHIVYYS